MTADIRHRFTSRWTSLLLATALSACDVGPADVAPGDSFAGTSELSVGSTGDDVRRTTDYLTDHGYFPNAELAQAFPAWRPLVADAPADASVFDARTQRAVRLLQANNGLPQTGVVDAETRTLMGRERCGAPDGITALDASDKYSLAFGGLGKRTFTWKTTGAANGLTPDRTRELLATATAAWRNRASGLEFLEVTNGAATDITFTFGVVSGHAAGGNTSMFTTSGGQRRIIFSSSALWSDIEGFAMDLQMQAEHQLGHILGFNHSAWPSSQMTPAFAMRRALALDDMYAVSSIYDNYAADQTMTANDVAVGSGDAIWIISKVAAAGGDFLPARFETKFRTWTLAADGIGGVRIAVDPSGFPWIVKSNGTILRKNSSNPTSGVWVTMPGSATDIGIAAPPTGKAGGAGVIPHVWITSKVAVNGGFQVQKFNFATNTWTPSNGGARRVSVTASGIPWITAASGAVFRHTTSEANTGSWQQLSGALVDIGVGPEQPSIGGALPIAIAWSVATNSSNQVNLSPYAEQPSSSDIPYANGWLGGQPLSSPGGLAASVAVTADGSPIVVDNQGTIFRSIR